MDIRNHRTLLHQVRKDQGYFIERPSKANAYLLERKLLRILRPLIEGHSAQLRKARELKISPRKFRSFLEVRIYRLSGTELQEALEMYEFGMDALLAHLKVQFLK